MCDTVADHHTGDEQIISSSPPPPASSSNISSCAHTRTRERGCRALLPHLALSYQLSESKHMLDNQGCQVTIQ